MRKKIKLIMGLMVENIKFSRIAKCYDVYPTSLHNYTLKNI